MPRRDGKGFALNLPVEKGRLAPLRRKLHVFMLCPSLSRKGGDPVPFAGRIPDLVPDRRSLAEGKHIPHTTPALFRICP